MHGIIRGTVIIRVYYRDLYSLLTQLSNGFLSKDSVVE